MSIAFSPVVFWSLLAVVFLVWIGLTAVLMYHWNAYGKEDRRIRRMKRAYFVGSALLFLSAVSFIFSL